MNDIVENMGRASGSVIKKDGTKDAIYSRYRARFTGDCIKLGVIGLTCLAAGSLLMVTRSPKLTSIGGVASVFLAAIGIILIALAVEGMFKRQRVAEWKKAALAGVIFLCGGLGCAFVAESVVNQVVGLLCAAFGMAGLLGAMLRTREEEIRRRSRPERACFNCGYDRRGIDGTICPECGADQRVADDDDDTFLG